MKEHILFRSIITYSIDNFDHENNKILKSIGLNMDTFYNSKIYKRRPARENDIREAIISPSGTIKIIGKAGTGKTTVTTKVLREFSEKVLVQKIDLKQDTDIENEMFGLESKLATYLDNLLLSYITKLIDDLDIFRDDILEYYLNAKSKSLEHIRKNKKFTEIEGRIRVQYKREKKLNKTSYDLISWISDIEFGSKKYKLVEKLFDSLKPEDIIYFLINESKSITSCIIFFDNVDSIIDDKVRTAFFNIIDKYQSRKSDCITIIISFRSNNPSLFDRTDIGSFNDIIINMDKIDENHVDPHDVSEEELKILKNKGLIVKRESEDFKDEDQDEDYSGLTRKQIYYKKRKHISMQNERFSLQLLYRRIKYLFQKTKVIEKEFDINKLENMKELIFQFLNDRHLSITTGAISNYDRRESLSLLSGFISHLLENGLNDAMTSNLNIREKMTMYESHYYRWIARNTNIMSNNIKDVVKELTLWNHFGSNHTGCLFDLQLMNLILNYTDPSENSFKEARKLEVGDIVREFENIGVAQSDVLAGIFRIYKDGNKHLGFLELSRYFGIESKDDIGVSDEIWLTPRGENYVMYINFKYSFVCSLLNRSPELNNPISKNSFDTIFDFLVNLGEMYIIGLQRLRDSMIYTFPDVKSDYWIKYYMENFCIETPAPGKIPLKINYPNLHFINLLSSHLTYFSLLRKQDAINVNKNDIDDIYKKYTILIHNFERLVRNLVNKSEDRINIKEQLLLNAL